MKNSTFMRRVKSFFTQFFTKKRIIWGVVILIVLLIVYAGFIRKSSPGNIQTAVVKRQNIEKTVLTTGQVVSSTDLSLSFQASGVVRRLNVKEGDTVYTGQVLASLDGGSAAAQLASAKASYDKIFAGATSQDVTVSQATVDSAQTTLDNAKQDLLMELTTAYNNANVAVISNTNSLFSNPDSNAPQFGVPGTIQTNGQAVIDINNERIVVRDALIAWKKELDTASLGNIDQATADSIKYLSTISKFCNDIISLLSVYTQSSSSASATVLSADISSTVSTKSTVDTAGTTISNDMQAVKTAASSLASAEASLSLKKAPARPEDLSIAAANVAIAQENYNNTLIVAPTSGTITQVDIKLGEQAVSSKEAIKLLNVGQLHTEALVSEADIAEIQVGQTIDNTFDALGPDQHFESKVLTVNPASTVVSGVVNYKVTGSLDHISQVKPGMTANMTILVDKKENVIAIPSSSIVNKEGKHVVKVIDDPKTKTYHEVEVQTALEADGGLTEIVSGLSENQQVITYMK